MPLAWEELDNPFAVNVGNPHVVFFVKDADAVELSRIGPIIETDPVFPQAINVNIASLAGENHLKLHVWERGAGLTRACGTGACATAVAAISRGLVQSPVRVTLPGGDLEIAWKRGGTIRMSGPAKEAFRGEFASPIGNSFQPACMRAYAVRSTGVKSCSPRLSPTSCGDNPA